MRQIGTISDARLAERFQDHLLAAGTKCTLDDTDDGVAVWVYDDDRVADAKEELQRFLANPDDERYLAARAQADAVLRAEAAKRKAARQNTVSLSRQWSQPAAASCPITVGILVICVFVWVVTDVLPDDRGLRSRLLFSTTRTWKEIQQGEWWRLLTPSLLHFGPIHILFNMLAWWQLGRMIECRKGSTAFAVLTLLTALATDVLQFIRVPGPFGGMSGVVYGLFGYAWMKGKLDPEDGIGVGPQMIQSMLVWFVVCWFLPFVANWGHFGGLMAGVTLGSLSAFWGRWNSPRL